MKEKHFYRIRYHYVDGIKDFSVVIDSDSRKNATLEFWHIVKESFGIPNGIRIIKTARRVPAKEDKLLRRDLCFTS